MLGYTYDHGPVGGDADDMPVDEGEDITYLSLFITIEPPLAQPEPMRERVSGGWGRND